jgi:hypothetical protein
MVKRVAKAIGVLALISLAGLAVLLAALWVDHCPVNWCSNPRSAIKCPVVAAIASS